ncbi:DUF2628 domain-containing protein [Jiella sp. MQZ9-1]|uniref:DUF2628 domain-containing protein n=1 Tax=Jiella flava TaxID=2816857 RepID=A0A939FXV7_9HYPH|nr:DUF2628 domain-containing protein [Jiella flava]MCD2470665.1 DUF2628 domain-containing protein [Jiella flava]
MTRYLVFEPPEATAPSGEAVFVRDRFSVFAFLFTFLWMFRHGLWRWGLLSLAGIVIANLIGMIAGFQTSAAIIALLLAVLIGLEGPHLRAADLRKKGWQDAAIFEAEDTDDAELIYYHAVPTDLPTQPSPPSTPAASSTFNVSESPASPSAPAVSPSPGGEDQTEDLAKDASPSAPEQGAIDGDQPVQATAITRVNPTAPRSPFVAGDHAERLRSEIERTAKVEGWAERWNRPGVELARVPGGRRKPVGRL